MNLSNKVMQGDIQKVLLVATLALGSVFGETVCQHRVSWWDRKRGACVPCTPCDPAASLVVRYPCEVYRDTVCQPLAEQNYDNKDSDSDYEYYETDYGEVSESEWDVQSTTLVLAASGCVVFFVLVLALWLYNAKQCARLVRKTETNGGRRGRTGRTCRAHRPPHLLQHSRRERCFTWSHIDEKKQRVHARKALIKQN
ncbi:hypothetical protein MSG28_001737 [Choristoneura fumiferana]|uniref:Uncharacterized protein n=1 Tax=Choristoneura fumiferana TaxID=7141 RepID=A0ACC0KVT5_CHOFU|nr:hypothetical protein MSG28_001737 [Choristoneura fumiferana]